MNEKKVTKITTIEDVNIVAYLMLKGFQAIPYLKETKDGQGPRVAWDVAGSRVDAVIEKYYGNDKIGIRDYVRVLKEVRGGMYSLKSQSGK